jgi:hypothetical protein
MVLIMLPPQNLENVLFMLLLLAACIDFIINIPFGYWRANVKRFSLQWFLSIHIPIPFIVLIRIYTGIGFEFITYPIMLTAFFLGQLAGLKIYSYRKKQSFAYLSSCLFKDLYEELNS